MPPSLFQKLKNHLAASPRYEPLIVRPHPEIPSHYQLINGHHRARALAALSHSHAACLIWDLDEPQTLLLLATCNRLSGDDLPTRRLQLLQSLRNSLPLPASDLAQLLPEDSASLAQLLDTSPPPPPRDPLPISTMPVAFTLFITAEQKQRLLAALHKTHPNPSTALLTWLENMESSPPSPNPNRKPPANPPPQPPS